MKEEEGLDRIFKQGLSEPGHIADYRESDWDAFEQMLDEKEKKRPVILWLRIASGIAAVLLLAFGWFYMQGSHTQITKQPLAVQPVKKGGDNTSPAVPRVSSSGRQVAVAAPVKDNTGTSGGLDHQNAGGVIKTPSSVKRNHILAVDRPYRKDKSFFTLSPPAARRDTAGLVSNDNSIYARNSIETLAAVNEQQIDAQNAKGMISFPSVEKNDDAITGPIKDPVPGSKRRAQFALTVLASPSINSVNSYSYVEVGSNIGLQFSVSVSKFTFTTGATYAKTPYLTPFDSYHTVSPLKYNPLNVSADCRVLDIPLNVDYRVYSKARNSFSVGSGLSSYIMLSEDYKYNYAFSGPYSNPGNYPSGITIVNQNQHFLGVLNLDATYQHRLNSKLSLDIQPYLKIPLTDIGYSRVKLQTAGVAFGLSWNLNSLRKP